jgi:large subunit ribosomal protein L12
MEYMYAAMLLHSAGKEINEESINNILASAGVDPDPVRTKALVAALSEVNIDEALKTPTMTTAPVAAPEAPVEEEEVEEEEVEVEEEEEEEDLQGLGALFGPP